MAEPWGQSKKETRVSRYGYKGLTFIQGTEEEGEMVRLAAEYRRIECR